VPVTCSVTDAGGAELAGLTRANFRIYDNGVEQPITYFDASTQPATIALVIDASPSTLPQSMEIKDAARALVDGLSPTDQVAVIDFSAHTYLQLPFSNDWGLIRKAISRIDVRELFGDTGGSNIYQSVFLHRARTLRRTHWPQSHRVINRRPRQRPRLNLGPCQRVAASRPA
jgi:VWFA-related protein